MILTKSIQRMRGFVEIKVTGFFTERFLNICTRRGIYLWNVQKTNKNELQASIGIEAFKKLRPIARKSRCTVKISKREGAPFVLHKYRKRKFFALGVLLFVVFLATMAQFVWEVEIGGNERISTAEVTRLAESCGVKSGMATKAVDAQRLQFQLMTLCPDFAWVGVERKGTTVKINVRERAVTPQRFPAEQPCDMVATADGVIQSLEVTNGLRLINPNDVVKKGQVLVAGTIPVKLGGVRYVHADGIIRARTWHEKKVPLPLYEEVTTRTGKNKSKHGLKIFQFYVTLYINDAVPFERFERVSQVKRPTLWHYQLLPVSFHYDKFYELAVRQRQLSTEEAITRAKQQMDESLAGAEILSRQGEVSQDGTTLTLTYECVEQIGEQAPIAEGGEEPHDNGKTTGS